VRNRIMRLVVCIGLLVVLSASASAAIKVNFWHSIGALHGQILEEFVDEFNKSQSEIIVEATYMGDHTEIMQKVMAAIAGRATPHLSTMSQRHGIPQLYDSGALLAIDDAIEKYGMMDKDDFYQGFVERYTYRGKMVAAPFAASTPVIHYNKDLFREAGLDPERGPETWEELVEFAKALTKDTNNDGIIDQWGITMGADTPWYIYAMLGQSQVPVLDENLNPLFDSPESVEVFQFWSDLVHVHKVMPPLMHANSLQDFVTGKAGMLFQSIASRSKVIEAVGDDFDYGIAFLPGNKVRSVPVGGTGLAIYNAKPEEEKAAFTFMSWFLSPEIAARWSIATGYVPVTKSAAELPIMKEYLEEVPRDAVGVAQLVYLNSVGTAPADFEVWQGFTTILEEIESDPNLDIAKRLKDLATAVKKYNAEYIY
jgi:sn-glycerol 3-phosphate transport system substrate-binding protein